MSTEKKKPTLIKHVYGNVLRVAIPLTQIVKQMTDGHVSEIKEEFYPNPLYPTTVVLRANGIRKYTFPASVSGNVATFKDEANTPVGTYGVEVLCHDAQENPMRYMVNSIIQIVDATIDACIKPGIEFNVQEYILDGTVFFYAKGDKGDPFTYEDFTPEQIEDLKRPAREAAIEVASLEARIEEAERSRVLAEEGRVGNESTRQNAETRRGENEALRVQAETERQQQENARAEAERLRAVAEQERVQAERERVLAESGRVSAETARQQETDAALARVQTAIDDWNRTRKVLQTESDVEIQPNVNNIWNEPISELTITFAEGVEGYDNEYMIQFRCPENSETALHLPQSVIWMDDEPLEPEAGWMYQISIIDNMAVYAGWKIPE